MEKKEVIREVPSIETVFVTCAVCGNPMEVLKPEAGEHLGRFMHIECAPPAEPHESAEDE